MKPILIIEDEPLIRRAYRRILEMNDFLIEEASDANEGRQKLEELDYQVSAVVLDLLMPKYDGHWFFEKLDAKMVELGIPVIVLSGHVEKSQRFPASCKRALVKPVSTSVLVDTLREFQRS